VEDGICDLSVGDDGGATLLGRPPCRVHFGGHPTPTPNAVVSKHNVAVKLRAVRVDDPAQAGGPHHMGSRLVEPPTPTMPRCILKKCSPCRPSWAGSFPKGLLC
jgi:hypothetical protein